MLDKEVEFPPYYYTGGMEATAGAAAFASLSALRASRAGFAGKGVIKPQGKMGVFRREAFRGLIDSSGRLIGAHAPGVQRSVLRLGKP